MNTKVLLKKINKIQEELTSIINELNTTKVSNESKEYTEQEISVILLETLNINKPDNAEVLSIQRCFVDNGKPQVYVDFKGGRYTLTILNGEGVIISTHTFKLKQLIKVPAVLNYLKKLHIGDIANRETMTPKLSYLSI